MQASARQKAAAFFASVGVLALMTAIHHSGAAGTTDTGSDDRMGDRSSPPRPSAAGDTHKPPMKPEIDGRWQIALPAADGMRDDSCVSSAEDNDIRFGAAASHASPSRWPRWRSPLDDIGSENRAALMWASRRTTEEGVADLTRPGVLSVFQFPSVDTSGLRRIPGPSGGASTNGIHTGCLPGESDFVEAAPDVGSCSFDSTQSPIGLWRMQISAGGKRAHTANTNAHTHTRTPAHPHRCRIFQSGCCMCIGIIGIGTHTPGPLIS